MPTDLRKAELPEHLDTFEVEDPYYAWQATEGVKVIREYRFDDLRTIELGDWERKGGKGAVLMIPNPVLTNDMHIVEIRPAGKSEPEHHMYEEVVYVLSGQGTTHLWAGDGEKKIIEWQAGSLFTIPLNVSYQHFNGSGQEPARYAGMTNLPVVLRTFGSTDFVFNDPYQFADRYTGEDASYFNGDGKLFRAKGRRLSTIWKTNFVPNADTMPVWDYPDRGAKGINTHFRLDSNTTTQAHISEFPVGTYKKAHRHGPGAHLVILGGVGFSLLWWGDKPEDRVKADWHKGSLVIIPFNDTFHQHFNTGPEPARYLAMTAYTPPRAERGEGNVSQREGGRQIEYEDEDPEIHRIFEDELKKHGAECKMGEFIPWCTAGPGK